MIDAPLTLLSAFVLGLFGTVHCVAMCGTITGAFCMALPQPAKPSLFSNLNYIIGFNLGRISTYTIAGLIFGFFGQKIYGSSETGHQVLVYLSHLMLFAAGVYLTGFFPALLVIEKPGAKLWTMIQPITKKLLPVDNLGKSYIYGLIWGYLPCGLLYFTLLWSASAGNAIDSAARMAAFGLGTLPGLIGTGVLASRLPGFLKNPMTRRIAGLIIIALTLISLYLALTSGHDHSHHHHHH